MITGSFPKTSCDTWRVIFQPRLRSEVHHSRTFVHCILLPSEYHSLTVTHAPYYICAFIHLLLSSLHTPHAFHSSCIIRLPFTHAQLYTSTSTAYTTSVPSLLLPLMRSASTSPLTDPQIRFFSASCFGFITRHGRSVASFPDCPYLSLQLPHKEPQITSLVLYPTRSITASCSEKDKMLSAN